MPEKRDHLGACAQEKCFKGISEIVKIAVLTSSDI